MTGRGQRHVSGIASLKLSQSLVTLLFEQAVLAQYMQSGACKLRERLAANLPLVLAAMQRHFSLDCRVTSAGGWWLWVECAPGVDTLAVLRQAVGQGEAFTPGVLFSAMASTATACA